MKKRRKTRVKNTSPSFLRMGVLITVLTLIVAAAAVLMAPAFNVTEIYCEGNVTLKTDEILSATQLETGKNILLSNIGKAKRRVEDFPIVKQAEIRRVFPNKICITVTERIPAAYLTRGGECIAAALDGTVLEVITDGRAAELIEQNTPESEPKNTEEQDRKQNEEETSSGDTQTAAETDAQQTETESDLYSVPLIAGIEVKETKAGDKIKAEDNVRLEKLLELCSAMSDAHILERATYIDISNIEDIRVIIENRLDIYIGNAENITYRARFLAEVVTGSISSYEHAVIDYRGDDIYVRAPEDGKDRIVREEEETDEKETEAENENEDVEAEEEDNDISDEIQM